MVVDVVGAGAAEATVQRRARMAKAKKEKVRLKRLESILNNLMDWTEVQGRFECSSRYGSCLGS